MIHRCVARRLPDERPRVARRRIVRRAKFLGRVRHADGDHHDLAIDRTNQCRLLQAGRLVVRWRIARAMFVKTTLELAQVCGAAEVVDGSPLREAGCGDKEQKGELSRHV